MDYAWEKYGLKWFQSNAWSGDLQEKWFGTEVLNMMVRHTANGFFSLEDETGVHYETLSQRIHRMEQIRLETGVFFQSVSLNSADLTTDNQGAIQYLISWIQAGKTP